MKQEVAEFRLDISETLSYRLERSDGHGRASI